MVNLRFEAVAEAFKKRPLESMTTKERPSEYFAKKVFNRQKMYKYLPLHVYEKLTDVIDNGTQLDRSIADDVAAGMKQWARETASLTTPIGSNPLRKARQKSMMPSLNTTGRVV